jgi:hypothetical protein
MKITAVLSTVHAIGKLLALMKVSFFGIVILVFPARSSARNTAL